MFLGHGTADSVFPCPQSMMTYEYFKDQLYQNEYKHKLSKNEPNFHEKDRFYRIRPINIHTFIYIHMY